MAGLLDEAERRWRNNGGGGSLLDQAEQRAMQTGAIQPPAPPPDEDILSNLFKGAKAGVAGTYGGLAGWVGGKNAIQEYLDDVVQSNQRSREHDGYDLDYFLNGSGLAYDVGNLFGALGAMAPAAFAVPEAAGVAGAGALATGLGRIGLTKAAEWAAKNALTKGGGALGNYIRYGLGSGTLESASEGGSGVTRAVEEGKENPYAIGAEIFAKNWPLLVGSQALEGGILHRGFSRLGGKAGESLGTRAAKAPFRTAPYMAGEGLTESAQEVMQERASEEAFGEPTGGLLPDTWTDAEKKAFYATFAPAALLGGVGGVRGSMRQTPTNRPPERQDYLATWDDSMGKIDSRYSSKWESQPGATDLANLQDSVAGRWNGLASEYGGGLTITGGAEKGYHEAGENGHEGGWKIDVDKNSVKDEAKFLDLARKYGFAVGDEGDHYDLSANPNGKVGGEVKVSHADAGTSGGGWSNANAKAIYDVFKAAGYNDNAIAGILGRVQHEHNFDTSDVPEHEEEGMHLGGYGMFQWNGGRTTAFLNWAQENGLDPQSATTQAQYALLEAQQRGLTPEKMNQLSHEEAADLWTSDWEVGRPGDERKYAGEWLTRLQNGGGMAGGTTASTTNTKAPQVPTVDTYDDVYEQFAKEQSQTSDEETKDFFSGMFTKNDKFIDTEENRRKIDERYGEELKEFADVYRNPSVQTQIDRLIDKAVEAKDYNRVGKLQAARKSGDIQLMQKYLDEAKAQKAPQIQGQTVPQVIPQQAPAQNVPQAQPAFPIVQEPAQNAPQPAQQTEQAQPIQVPTQQENAQQEPVVPTQMKPTEIPKGEMEDGNTQSTQSTQAQPTESINTANQNQNAEPGQAEEEVTPQAPQPTANGFVNNTVTAEKGKQFPGVTWDGRVEKDEWTRRKEIAKENNGWWDGKSKSFGFRTEQDRANFLQAVNAPTPNEPTAPSPVPSQNEAASPATSNELQQPKKASTAVKKLKKNVAKVVADYRADKISYDEAVHKVLEMQNAAENAAPDQATRDEIQDIVRSALLDLESIYEEKNGHGVAETPSQTAQESAGEQETTAQAEEPTQEENAPSEGKQEAASNEGGEKSAQDDDYHGFLDGKAPGAVKEIRKQLEKKDNPFGNAKGFMTVKHMIERLAETDKTNQSQAKGKTFYLHGNKVSKAVYDYYNHLILDSYINSLDENGEVKQEARSNVATKLRERLDSTVQGYKAGTIDYDDMKRTLKKIQYESFAELKKSEDEAEQKALQSVWEDAGKAFDDVRDGALKSMISEAPQEKPAEKQEEKTPKTAEPKQEKFVDRHKRFVQRLGEALDNAVEKQDVKIIQKEIISISDEIEKAYSEDIRKAAKAGIGELTPDSLATAAWNELHNLRNNVPRHNGASPSMRQDIASTFSAEETRLSDSLDELINSLEKKQEKPAKTENNTVKEDNGRIFKDTKTADEEMLEALGLNDEAFEDIEVQGVDNIDDEIEALTKELSRELSKLNANPVFNPRVYTVGLKLAILLTKKGFNNIKKLVAELNARFGKDIEPWSESIIETVRTWPSGLPFNEKQVMYISQAIGARYEDGITSLDAVQADMAKKLKKQHARFAPMIEASYNGISKFFENRKEGMENGEGGKPVNADGGRTAGEEGLSEGTGKVQAGSEGRGKTVTERPEASERTGEEVAEPASKDGEAPSEAGNTGGLRSSVPGAKGQQDNGTPGKDGVAGRTGGSGAESSSLVGGGRGLVRGTDGEGQGSGGTVRNTGEVRTDVVNLDNYHIEDTDALFGGGQKARFARNKKAIETYQDIVAAKRQPTKEEKDIMAAFTGWGSFGQELFQGTYDNPKPREGWEKESDWLREYLGKEAWESAKDSIINAHYTAPNVVSAMWDMVRNLGFKGGRVLEPSMGVGNFFGLMPKDMEANSTLFGVEMESTTGGMAKMLYPKANIKISPYQNVHVADGTYDLIIGNVPFSNKIKPADRRYVDFDATLHNYFFLKGIDELRPGGIMMAITSRFTMDGTERKIRMELAKKAELVDAYRFPTGAFKDYAGTEVVTDVIILKKREKPLADVSGEEWIGTVKHEVEYKGRDYTYNVNKFFEAHPEKVLGETSFGKAVGPQPGLNVAMDAEKFQSQLDNMADTMKEKTNGYEEPHYDQNIKYVSNNTNDRMGTLQEKNGELYVAQGLDSKPMKASEEWKLIGNPKKGETIAERLQELKELVKLRETYNKLEDAEKNDAKDLDQIRKELKAQYDSYVQKYLYDKKGKRKTKTVTEYDKDNNKKQVKNPWLLEDTYGLRQFSKSGEPNYAALCALMTKDGKPAKILTERVMRKGKDIENPSVKEALMIQRNQSMRIDVDEIARLAKKSKEEVLKELGDYLFKTPTGEYQVRDQYLSGNVRRKLREAKAALENGDKDMERNIKALEEIMPADIPYYNINVGFGATWIDIPYYKEFIASLIGTEDVDKIELTRNLSGSWKVEFNDSSFNNTAGATTTYGVSKVKFNRLLQHAFNGTKPKLSKKDDNDRTVDDVEGMQKANDQIEKIKETFEDWIWKDENRKLDLAHTYNEVLNNTSTPIYDGSFLDMEGMMLKRGENDFNLRQHQINAIYRGLVNGRGLYAHEVGTGKTYTMGGLALESRRFGLAKKPLILAHNANSQAVAQEIQEMYPGAKILYVSGDSESVRRDIMRIKTDDWDVVVLPHSKVDKLTLKEETLDALAADIIADLEDQAREAAKADNIDLDKVDIDDEKEVNQKLSHSPTAKELVKERLKIKEDIKKYAYNASDEKAIAFEDLGVDMIIVDESHVFKKPPFASKLKVKGLQKQSSGNGVQLNFLSQYVQSQNNGRGVHLFTGTPITNTVTEMYHNMKYIMPNEMKEAGVYNFDDWFHAFAQINSSLEYTPTGETENVDRLNAFVNLAELRRIVGQYMDIVFAEDMPEFEPRKTESGKTLADKDLTDEEREYLINGRDENPKGRPYCQTINEVIPMNEAQKNQLATYMGHAKRWKKADKKGRKIMMVEQNPAAPGFTEGAMNKAAMDARMLNPSVNVYGMDSKEERVARNVKNVYEMDDRTTQCIMVEIGYSDSSEQIPRDENGFPLPGSYHEDENGKVTFTKAKVETHNLVKSIIKRLEAEGIPRSEIAVVSPSFDAKGLDGITVARNAKAKAEVAEKVKHCEIRVVIGSSSTLGTGVNMQDNLKAMHHIDAPWMPGDLEQRNGRIVRQGNKWNTVLEFRYITEKLDGRRWQVLATKQKFIKMFMKADENLRVLDGDAVDVSDENGSGTNDFEETLSKATGDPRFLRKANLETTVKKLERSKASFDAGIEEAKYKLSKLKGGEIDRLKESQQDIRAIEDTYAKYKQSHPSTDDFEITIKGDTLTKREDANKAIAEAFNGVTIDKEFKLGEFAGLELYGMKQSNNTLNGAYGKRIRIRAKGKKAYIDSADSIAGITQNLARTGGRIEKIQQEIERKESDVKTFEKQVKETYPREKVLEAKRKELNALLKDLEENPTPPPAWLVEGAPAMADVLVDGKKGTVENYRVGGNISYSKDNEGNLVREITGEPTKFYVGVKLEGEEDVRYIPWQEVKDTQGLPMITAPEGVEESPKYKEEKPQEEEKPSSNRKYSINGKPEATIRSMDELKAEVKEAFPNAKVQEQGNTLKLTMPNGQKVTVTLKDRITAGKAEMDRARREHGFGSDVEVTIEGYAETVDGEGFMALAQGSREGTGFHEAYHIAEAMAFTKKELADAKRLISDNAEERADAYAKWKLERKKGNNFAKLWQKIADVAAKLAGILGYETKRNIFRKVESGEVYRRDNTARDVTRQYSFAGEKAETAAMDKLEQARAMEQSGASRQEIFDETGWVKGKDGKWRFEIPDNLDKISFAKLRDRMQVTGRDEVTCTLPDVYANSALYKAYPFLREVYIATEEMDEGWLGHLSKDRAGNIVITIPVEMAKKKRLSVDEKTTLLHEIQHAIQDYEGFARGTSPEWAKREFMDDIGTELDNLSAEKSKLDINSPRYKEITQRINDLMEEVQAERNDFLNTRATSRYRRYGGEEESREVESRAIDRKMKVNPGVPFIHSSDAIIKFNGKEMPMAKLATGTTRQYSVNASDNSTSSYKQRVKNFFTGKQDAPSHRRMLKNMMEEIADVKISYGKLDEGMEAIYKGAQKVIRVRNANDWEKVVPLFAKAVCNKIGIKADKALTHYISDWIQTGAPNNNSAEADTFAQAMREYPEIADQLLDLQSAFMKWNQMDAMKRMQSIVSRREKEKTSISSMLDYAYDQVIEELGPVKRLVKQIEGKIGKQENALNPYVAFRLFRGHHGRAMTMLEGSGADMKAVLAKHYPNLNWDGFKTLHEILDSISGLNDEKIRDEFGNYALACHVYDIHLQNDQIEMQIDLLKKQLASTTDAEKQKELQEKIDRLDRSIMMTPISRTDCGKIIREYGKRYGQAQQDLVHFSNMTLAILKDSGVISETRYARILRKWPNYVPMFRVFDENEQKNFGDSLKALEGSTRDVIDPLESIIRNTFDFVKKAEKNKAKCLLARLAQVSDVGKYIEPVDNNKPNDDTVITYYVDGQKRYLQTDPSVVAAVNGMGIDQSNLLMKILRFPARLARSAFTVTNPAFLIRNSTRDMQDAFIYNDRGTITPMDFVRAFMHAFRKDDIYWEWMSSGAAQASAISIDRDYAQATLDKMTKSWKQMFKDNPVTFPFKAFLDATERLAEFSELGTRIAAYERTKKALAKDGAALTNMDLAEAAYESRDLMDFARGGKASRQWNSLAIFANASIQGWDKFFRTFNVRKDPKAAMRAMARLAIGGMLPALLLTLANWDEDWWKEIPDWQKDSHWILAPNVRIPKGQDIGLRFVSSMIEKGLDAMHNNNPLTAKRALKPIYDQTPDILPTAMLPVIEAMANYSFFKEAPIVPQYQKDLPAKLQYSGTTSGLAKALGDLLNYSPRKIDHLIQGYTGSIGKGATSAMDMARGEKRMNTAIEEMPVFSGFMMTPYKNSATVEKFYKEFRTQTEGDKAFKATRERMEGYSPAKYKRMSQANKKMSELNKKERKLLDDNRISPERKQELQAGIQRQRIAIAKRAMGVK